eukprot:CAMPEP_0195508276 /NCGR_PEP_ID=MMETSP0794_2-20130614/1521_1 /TAXON_ID=515487 /ORGANISM="Stephanopyxis turris, Strain CCMP 815" /LENGTH=850 /DNA_ID=CAMNT_0040635189 /DNA_START=146 /DNA_END=2698 /DNA_ORIENTATION=-
MEKEEPRNMEKEEPRNMEKEEPRNMEKEAMKALLTEWFDNKNMVNIAQFLKKRNMSHMIEEMKNRVTQNKLRRLRKERDNAGVREDAMSRIENISSKEDLDGVSCRLEEIQLGEKEKQSEEKEAMKMLLIEWFNDENMLTIAQFLKKRDMPHNGEEMKRLVTRMNLRRLRKERENGGVREKAMSKIEASFSNRGLRKKPHDSTIFLKALLIDWFNDDNMTPISQFLKKRDARENKEIMIRLVRKNRLRKLRKERDNVEAREEAMSKIDNILLKEDLDGGSCCLGQPQLNEKEAMKALLVDFFNDGNMLNIAQFLKKRNMSHKREEMKRLVSQTNLRKLRNERENDGVREKAMSKIENICLNRANKEKSHLSIVDLKALIIEWFNDENMTSIPPFLKRRGALENKDVVIRLVRKNGLLKLRKERDNDEARDLAMSKIDNMSLAQGKVSRKNKNGIRQKMIKSAIKEWFIDEDKVSIRQFLEQRGELEIRASVCKLATKNGLRELRKERENPEVYTLAMKKINDLFSNDLPQKSPRLCIKSSARSCPQDPHNNLMVVVVDKEGMKDLLKDWFADEGMSSIPVFLQGRGAMALKPSMLRLVKGSGLTKLRTERDDPEVQQLAASKIDCLLTKTVLDSRSNYANHQKEVPLHKKKRRDTCVDEAVKILLKDWFVDEKFSSVSQFLRERDALEKKDIMVRLVKKNSLLRLRKERENAKMCEIAMSRIENISTRKGNVVKKKSSEDMSPPHEVCEGTGTETSYVNDWVILDQEVGKKKMNVPKCKDVKMMDQVDIEEEAEGSKRSEPKNLDQEMHTHTAKLTVGQKMDSGEIMKDDDMNLIEVPEVEGTGSSSDPE